MLVQNDITCTCVVASGCGESVDGSLMLRLVAGGGGGGWQWQNIAAHAVGTGRRRARRMKKQNGLVLLAWL